MRIAPALAALIGLAVAAPAFSAAPASTPAQREASIPFVGSGSIRNWRPLDRDTLYVQDVHRRWYRAELIGPCIDLPYAETIGFDVRGTNRFDRFSSVIVRGQHCAVSSVVASDPPPPRRKRTHS